MIIIRGINSRPDTSGRIDVTLEMNMDLKDLVRLEEMMRTHFNCDMNAVPGYRKLSPVNSYESSPRLPRVAPPALVDTPTPPYGMEQK